MAAGSRNRYSPATRSRWSCIRCAMARTRACSCLRHSPMASRSARHRERRNHSMRARSLISIFVAVLMLPTAQGDTNRATRATAFAKLPDWTGIWQSAAWWPLDVSGRPAGGEAKLLQTLQITREPPYNAKWAATYQEAMKDTAAIAERVRTFKVCERTFPAVMEAPWMFQVAVLPEETLI